MSRRMIGIALGLAPLLLAGCEPGPEDLARAGLTMAFTTDRPWRYEEPPPDTFNTVTRRVWSGPLVDQLVSPSPDGMRLARTEWVMGDIAIHDLETGEERRLTHNTAPYEPGFGMYPRMSPDGEQVAYTWWQSEDWNDWHLQVVDAEDAQPRTLVSADPWIHPEDWSPDGRQILALRELPDGTNEIVTVSVTDGLVRVLKALDWRYPTRMVFSPDGDYILYDLPPDPESEQLDVFALSVDGGQDRAVVEHPANDYVLGWAPDGRHILFGSDRTGTPGAWLLPVEHGTASGAPVLVKPDLWQVTPVGFIPDGSFFYAVQTGMRDVHVAALDLATGRVAGPAVPVGRRRTGSRTFPSWSPDGRYLAYLTRSGTGSGVQRATLAIRSLETGEVRQLRLPLELVNPREQHWLEDGRTILLKAWDNQNRWGLHRVDIQTGEIELVFHRPRTMGEFVPTSDGAAILYRGERGGPDVDARHTIVRRDLKSGRETVLYSVSPVRSRQIRSLALSPDGATLAFVLWRRLRQPSWLMVMPVAGGEPRELVRANIAFGIDWAPDGQSVVYVDYEETDEPAAQHQLWRVDVTSGEAEDLGLAVEGLSYVRVSPDGARVAFAAGQQAAEIWVMEEFLP